MKEQFAGFLLMQFRGFFLYYALHNIYKIVL